MVEAARGRGIQSIEIGYRVLLAIQAGTPASLKSIAERSGLSPSAAHNYLTSLVRTGLVEIVGRGQYQFGPSLASLGLMALQHTSTFDVVRAEATSLSLKTDRGVAVLVWNETGPIIIFFKEGVRRGAFDLRNGPVSCLHTGGGHVFVAYMEPTETLPVVLREGASEGLTSAEAQSMHKQIRNRVRSAGYATCELTNLPGYSSISAPIWNSEDRPIYAITVTGPAATINTEPDSEHVKALKASARLISRQLGSAASRWAVDDTMA